MPDDDAQTIEITVLPSLCEVTPEAWDACACPE